MWVKNILPLVEYLSVWEREIERGRMSALHREPEMGVIFPYAFEVLIGRNKAYVWHICGM